MDQFLKFLEKNASGRKVLALFLLTNAVYLFMLLISIPLTMEFSGGMKLLDMLPTGYDRNYVHELFAALGTDGRLTYLTKQIPVDMFYPLLFGITYSLLLAYFLKKLNKFKTAFVYLCLLPVIAGAADYFENLGILSMLSSYPAVTEFAAQTTNFFSLLKSGFTTAFFLVLIILLVVLAIKALTVKRTGAKVKYQRQG